MALQLRTGPVSGLWSGKVSKAGDAAPGALTSDTQRPLDRIYRQHWDEICRYVRRSFGAGPPDPEDVAQAAFARFAALDVEVQVANPRAFLFRTAHNIAIDARRSGSGRSCDHRPGTPRFQP
jgi:DNA-directed RNA polymerase specialized sigma24 family protein